MGLKFEAWTLPTAATFQRKFTIPEVLAGATGVRELSGWTDGAIPLPASWGRFDDLIAEDDASLIRVYDEGQIIDEMIAQRCPFSTERPSVRVVSGPGMNGIVEKCGVYALAAGVDDWIWGSEVNLLGNPFFSATTTTPVEWELEIAATGGSYTLTDGTDTTAAIAFDAQASTIATRLQTDLASITDVVVVGTAASPYRRTITLVTPPTGVSLAINTGSLSGGSGTITVTQAGQLGFGPWTNARALTIPASYGNYQNFGLDSVQAHSGGRSLFINPKAIQVSSMRNPGLQQVVKVTPGQTYQASIWIYPTSATDRFRLGIFTTGEEFVAWTDGDGETLTPDDWNQLVLSDVVIPADITEIIFRTAVTNPGVYEPSGAWYDDAVLSEGLPAASMQSIVDQLLTAAQDRGTFEFLEIDADPDQDSNGVALDEISFAAWYGQDLGHVLDGLHALGYNWKIRPASEATEITPAGTTTHVLKIYDVGTYPTDHTVSPGGPSILGGVAGPAQVVKRVPEFTAVRARGLGQLHVDDTNTTALANMGRWEKIIDAEQVTSAAALQLLIDAAFVDEDLNQTAATATLTYSDPARPLVRFSEGDRIWWQLPGVLAKEARPVKRIGWTYGTPTTYEIQGSRILSSDGGIARAVDYLLRQFQRRRGGDAAAPSNLVAASDTGAYVHLLAGVQGIPADGAFIEWELVFPGITPYEFTVEPPVDTVTIPKTGYYDVQVELAWSSWLDGGHVQVFLNGAQVWPPMEPGVWSASSGGVFTDTAKAIPCLEGDVLAVLVDHGDSNPQDLQRAVLTVELVDRRVTTPEPEVPPGTENIFIFTESGTFDWVAAGSPSTLSDVWIFGGGGSGAKGGAPNGWRGGGGGAGGLNHLTNYAVSGDVAVVVGNGGPSITAAPSDIARGSKGQNSSFDGQVAEGGGRGGVGSTDAASVGAMDGGCGGGGTTAGALSSGTPGTGSQGGDGGPAPTADDHSGGGGGVDGTSGDGESGADGGLGGLGIDLSAVVGTGYGDAGWFGGGGSGHGAADAGDGGGQGGGGDVGEDAIANSGGGGGGGLTRGGAGGKGIVIVKVT